MDFHFQGLVWFNKGMSPDNLAQARSFFDRALSADPDNVDALIRSTYLAQLEPILEGMRKGGAAGRMKQV